MRVYVREEETLYRSTVYRYKFYNLRSFVATATVSKPSFYRFLLTIKDTPSRQRREHGVGHGMTAEKAWSGTWHDSGESMEWDMASPVTAPPAISCNPENPKQSPFQSLRSPNG